RNDLAGFHAEEPALLAPGGGFEAPDLLTGPHLLRVDLDAAPGLAKPPVGTVRDALTGRHAVRTLGLLAPGRKIIGGLPEAQLAILRLACVVAVFVEGAGFAAREVVERAVGSAEVHVLVGDQAAAEAVAAVGHQRCTELEAARRHLEITAQPGLVGSVRAADVRAGGLGG